MPTHRYSFDALQKLALNTGHAFQVEAFERMQKIGWSCFAVNRLANATVLCVSRSCGAVGVVYPDGALVVMPKGKQSAKWNWQRAKNAAEATIPAATLVHARQAITA